eukprot:5239460-Prymnesium_polylepis.2
MCMWDDGQRRLSTRALRGESCIGYVNVCPPQPNPTHSPRLTVLTGHSPDSAVPCRFTPSLSTWKRPA